MDKEKKLKEIICKANKELREFQLKTDIQRKNKLIGRYFKHLGHLGDLSWWTYFQVRSVDELGRIHILMLSSRSDTDVEVQVYWTSSEEYCSVEIDSYEFWISFDRMMGKIIAMANRKQ